MAQLLGKKVRGRKKEALREAAATLAASLTAAKGEKEVTVEVVPGEGRRKGETVTLTIPKGAALVPGDLLGDKSPENIRQQLRNGAADAGVEVSIESFGWVSDNGTDEGTIFVMKPKEASA